MIYLDTSWLVKLFVAEPDSRAVREAVGRDDIQVISELAWVEFHAAVARRRREGSLPARTASRLVSRFREEWEDRHRVPVTREVVTRAADLVRAHPLRSLDALHLASALLVGGGAPEPVHMGTSDGRLLAAARAEGLEPPPVV